MQYISQMQTWDMARKITKKSNLPVIDGPTILMKRRRREELWWVEPSEMCVWYCFPFWCFYTICVRSWKFFFPFSCHFSSYFAKIVPRQFWIGQRGKLLKKALAMINIINLIIIIIIIIIVDVIFIFVFVIDIVIVLVIVIIIIIVILLQLLIISAFSLIIIIILFCSREKKTSLKPPWKFQFHS